MRLPSTTPQPAAASSGSMCSARVSASFMAIFLQLPAEGSVQQALLQLGERGELALVALPAFKDERRRNNWSRLRSSAYGFGSVGLKGSACEPPGGLLAGV